MIELPVRSSAREQMIDVTSLVQKAVAQSEFSNGLILCFVPHTTAAITLNENSDPDVKRDILHKLNREFPQDDGYLHGEGNSDAHLKSSLIGCSLLVPFEDRKLVLGTWQGICFCEFDGPRNRTLLVKVCPVA